jgi:RNA polymerase sigma factor (sigma-70 family)
MFENKRLIKLTNSNDKIDQVIQNNYMSIYKYCYYHVGNSDPAQDITQEVFLKFLKHVDRYKEYGKLRNYLYVIAKNCIRDYLRKAKQVNLETVIEGFDSGGIDRKLEQLNIWEAINSLEV